MYVPSMFDQADREQIVTFLRKYNFGTLITAKDADVALTHIPFEVDYQGDDHFYLNAHIASANEQVSHLDGEKVTVSFLGPHAYISSSWYEHVNVPTWNYLAVKVVGSAQVLSEEETRNNLRDQVHRYEGWVDGDMSMEKMSPRFIREHLDALVGFRIMVTDIKAAWKLSQNRNQKDLNSIVAQLEALQEGPSIQVAGEMKNLLKPGS